LWDLAGSYLRRSWDLGVSGECWEGRWIQGVSLGGSSGILGVFGESWPGLVKSYAEIAGSCRVFGGSWEGLDGILGYLRGVLWLSWEGLGESCRSLGRFLGRCRGGSEEALRRQPGTHDTVDFSCEASMFVKVSEAKMAYERVSMRPR
jgi:hypothetical protein